MLVQAGSMLAAGFAPLWHPPMAPRATVVMEMDARSNWELKAANPRSYEARAAKRYAEGRQSPQLSRPRPWAGNNPQPGVSPGQMIPAYSTQTTSADEAARRYRMTARYDSGYDRSPMTPDWDRGDPNRYTGRSRSRGRYDGPRMQMGRDRYDDYDDRRSDRCARLAPRTKCARAAETADKQARLTAHASLLVNCRRR